MSCSTPVSGARPAAGRLLPPVLLALACGLASCRDAKVTAYRIPKEPDAAPAPAAAASAPAPAMTVAARPAAELAWTAPATWHAKAPTSMRRGSFDVGEGDATADLAITAFPGDVGGDLANLNRWRGQLELPAVGADAVAAQLQPVPGAALPARLADLTGGGEKPLRMLAAIVPYAGTTWFFKLTGPAAVVAAEKARFVEFLATVHPAAPGADAVTAAPTAVPPAVLPAAPVVAGAGLRWQAPARWEEKPASAMRRATYVVPGAAGRPAELAISTFPGEVGGELANVNRWRGQLQLPPLDAAGLAPAVTRLEAHGLAIAVVEFSAAGADGPQRLLGAIVPHDGATWFFKLTGPDATVAAAKPEFLAFLQNLSP